MTIGLTKILAVALTLVPLAGTMSATPAAAEDGRNAALIGGLLAGGLLGGALAHGYRAPPRYRPEPVYQSEEDVSECYIERRPVYNRWGDVVRYRRVRICN